MTQARIVLLGPPGAGKGTQAAFIAEHLTIPHISTGDMMRAATEHGDELGQRVQSYLDQGQLVPDEVIIAVVRERLAEDDCQGGFLLDGFPRTIDQARALDVLLTEIDAALTHVIELVVPTELLIERLVKRGKDSGRSDDTREVIEERMQVYERLTRPVSDYYRESSRLVAIDGVGSIDEIRRRLRERLESGA